MTETGARLFVEEVTTTAGLEALRPEWADLWARGAGATPFQSPEWLIPWWRHVGEGDLLTLAVRRDGELLGLVPLYVYTQPESGSRDIFLLGIGTSDYLDAVLAPGAEVEVLAAAFAHMDGRRDSWDVCDLQQLAPGSALIGSGIPRGWREDLDRHEACPVLDLSDGLEGVPGRMRHNVRYYRRRAERLGEVRIDAATSETWAGIFGALLELHGARWRTKGEEGVLALPNVRAAHRESLPGLLALGALRLYALRLDERVIAVLYSLFDPRRGRERAYYYLGGMDPAFEGISPGTLLIGHAVEAAIAEGASAYDFLRGQEYYKYLWGARDTWPVRRWLWHG